MTYTSSFSLRSNRSEVRILSGAPVFYKIAAVLAAKRPLRPFTQPDFCPDIVHFVIRRLRRIPSKRAAGSDRYASFAKRRTGAPTMPLFFGRHSDSSNKCYGPRTLE